MAEDIAISLKNISKAFKQYRHPTDRLKEILLPGKQKAEEFRALKNITLEILKGETVGIIGQNGSGKSTLLQVIAGTLQPTSGEFQVNGRISALLELGSGFNPEFTGEQNVFFNGRILGLSQEEIGSKFDDIKAFANIGNFIQQPVKNYSSGMTVRLAFATAVHSDPDILIIDEALSVGDEAFQRKCFSKIRDIQRKGATILFVSHSANLITDLCDYGIWIESGEKIIETEPRKLIGLYQRFIYSEKQDIERLKHEIESDSSNVSIKRLREIKASKNKYDVEAQPVALTLSNSDKKQDNQTANDTAKGIETLDDFYDDNLASQSKIIQSTSKAIIQTPHIISKNKKKVNILIKDEVYTYKYRVLFSEDAFLVRFGMLIKSITGTELSGISSHSNKNLIRFIKRGENLDISFTFKCILNPGTYFLNAGVISQRKGVEHFLCRITDAVTFKVQATSDKPYLGFVDLGVKTNVLFLR